MIMSKFFKKIGRIIIAITDAFMKTIDKFIIMPISRLVYNFSKSTNSNNTSLNRLLNRPQFLIILALIFSVICFLLIDNKVINLVNNEAEVMKNIPVKVVYNEEAFAVENVPESVDVILAGNKSEIYLAKQLGEFDVELNLTKYTKPGTYKVYFTSNESIKSVDYYIEPSYLLVTLKDKVSEVLPVDYDLVDTDKLDAKLSVSSVKLDRSEVIVKGSQDRIDEIASIKALVSVADESLTEAGTYELTNIPLVAYNNKGEIVENVEIYPDTLTATVVLKSYKATVPLSIQTTGSLINGKAIASISINNSSDATLEIYGEENDIKNITSVPVTINVDGLGAESVKNYTVVIKKPNGVRYASLKSATITVTFGNEEQKTINVNDVSWRNLADGYGANIISSRETQVQVKGVLSNINKISANDIKAYVDLAGLGEGTYELQVKVDNDNPLIGYVVTKTITVKVFKK